MTLGKKKCREGLNVCMNYEFNLLHHVGVVAKGDDNTPSGPTGRGVKSAQKYNIIYVGYICDMILNYKHMT